MKPLLLGLPLLALTLAPAMAQFSPGPNPITGTVGAQTLTGGTGTVDPTGNINPSGNTVGVTMSGVSTLNNSGTIQQAGTGRAIDSNNANSNLTVNNSGLISSVSADAFRVNAAASKVVLTNSGTIQVTNGGQAIDFAAVTSGTSKVINQQGGVITAVGEDAVRVGINGIVQNSGLIRATTQITSGTDVTGSDGIDLRTFTGISVTNSGTISGRHGIATDGANTANTAYTFTNNAGGLIAAQNGSGINIDGVSVTVTANVTNALGATIQGGVMASPVADADGDGIDVDGVLTLNNSGDILGLGSKGSKDGSPNNSEAISLGGGSIINNATGRIVGSSLLTDAPNGDPTHAGNGILADNSDGGNAIALTTITNDGLIQGKTGFGVKIVGTFSDTITNNATGTIRGAGTGATIQMGDGADTLTNRGAIVSDIGNAIDLEGGDDALLVEGGNASIVGNISGGTGTNTFTINPGAGHSFSYSGTISNFSSITVQSGTVTFTAQNTYSGSTRVTGGALRLSGDGALGGGDVVVAGGAVLDISDIDASTYTLGHGQALTVGGTIEADGKTLEAHGIVNTDSLMTVHGSFLLADDGELRLEITGLARGDSYDALDVTGLLTLEGRIVITSSHIFANNESLDLFNFGSLELSGFDLANLILPTLTGGLQWDTTNFASDGSVRVVPEPSSCLLLISGAILLGARRFRRRA